MKALQKAIGNLAVDGSYGPLTEARVKEYQKSKGLAVTGVTDAKVWNALMGKTTTPPPTTTTDPLEKYVGTTLRRGSKGDAVKALQKAIGKLTVDGSYGPGTEARVKEYQKSKGLAVTGVTDAKVWNALMGKTTHPAADHDDGPAGEVRRDHAASGVEGRRGEGAAEGDREADRRRVLRPRHRGAGEGVPEVQGARGDRRDRRQGLERADGQDDHPAADHDDGPAREVRVVDPEAVVEGRGRQGSAEGDREADRRRVLRPADRGQGEGVPEVEGPSGDGRDRRQGLERADGESSSGGTVTPPTVESSTATEFTAHKGTTLRVGSSGAAVKALQRGLGGLVVDGAFGSRTLEAVRAFQTSAKLSVTGVVDRKTWDALELRVHPLHPYWGTVLKRGSSGAAVVALQKALRITADGAFGPKTEASVKAAQQAAKLTQTGVVGTVTWKAVEARMTR